MTASSVAANDASARPSRTRWLCGAVVVLTWTLQMYAIWARPFVPLFDLPNHEARHYLQSLALAGEPLPSCYELRWRLLPNLGSDAIIPFLMRFASPDVAMKIFLSLAVLLYWLGPTWFILEQCGTRPGAVLACLLLLPVTFSSQFFWGFLNFYVGIGLAFAALAHFTRLLRRDRLGVADLVLHAVFVTLLFLCHLGVWADYGIVMGCLVLADGWEHIDKRGFTRCLVWRALAAVAPSLPSLALCVFYIINKADSPGGVSLLWPTLQRKLGGPATLFSSYDWRIDGVVLALWLLAVAIGFAWRQGREHRGRGLLLSSLLLATLYLAFPRAFGSNDSVDTRLLPALLICAVGFMGCWPARRLGLAVGILAVCVTIRHASIIVAWNGLRDRLDAQGRCFDHLEPGSRVLPLILTDALGKEWPETHFPCLAVVFRQAMVPTVFTHPDQQPLHIRTGEGCAGPVDFEQVVGRDARMPDSGYLRENFDYVWLFNPHDKPIEVPVSFEPVCSIGKLTVWRVR